MYMVGQTYPLSNQHWQQAMNYGFGKDLLSNFYDVMPPLEAMKEMKDARFKGAMYQRREKKSPSKQYTPEDETIAESYSETYDENCNTHDVTPM